MFVYSILDFWGMSEDLPFVYKPGSQERYDWCIAQELTKRKDFTAFLETGVGAELAGATKRPAPSITSASPPTPKRKKRNCPFDIAQRSTMMGSENVQVICPDDETPHLEDKIVSLINTCARSKTLSSLDLLVCPRRPPRRKCGRAWANFFLLPVCSYRGVW